MEGKTIDNEIQYLRDKIYKIEKHFEEYKEHKTQSKIASKKADRNKATNSMMNSADEIEKLLREYPACEIIKDGNPFQFEDFWKYVASDMPDYLKALKAHLDKLKIEDNEE